MSMLQCLPMARGGQWRVTQNNRKVTHLGDTCVISAPFIILLYTDKRMLKMAWYVEFKDGTGTRTQTMDDRDEAVLVASYLHLHGQKVVGISPFGRDARSHHEIRGTALRTLLRKLAHEVRELPRLATGAC
jgi:hypothetical protein